MTRPSRYLLRMVIFLILVIGVGAMLGPGVVSAFLVNPFLNGVILGVVVLGTLYIFRQVLLLQPEVAWLERFRQETRDRLIFPDALSRIPQPRLLGPMATMLGERRGRLSLSALSMRTLLDSIQTRIDESHDLSRYIVGLLVFLGLLGTFWGLSETVGAVGDTIAGLKVDSSDASVLFEQLKGDLQRPLSGMGTAFTSSLFGLAGSLVVGFLELQSSQAHNRFMQDLEEWLSGVTRLSSGSGLSGEGEASVPAYIQALLEQTADSLDSLQRTIARGEEERSATGRNLAQLNERLGTLTAQGQQQLAALGSLADATNHLRHTLTSIGGGGLDEASRQHLRNSAIYLERLAHEMEAGRAVIVQEMRNEIRLLARTIAALAEDQR